VRSGIEAQYSNDVLEAVIGDRVRERDDVTTVDIRVPSFDFF